MIGDGYLRRASRLVRSFARYGARTTFIAINAKRRGAKQKLLEFAALVSLVRRKRPATIVEIGTLHGGTLWAWCRVAAENAAIISIDLPGGPFGGGYPADATDRLRAFAQPLQDIQLIRGSSHDPRTLARLIEILAGRQVDFLFIDADHTYEGVRADFETFSPLVRPGGLVALHDVLPHDDPTCEVDRFWREVATRYQHHEFLEVRDRRERQWGGIGVVIQSDRAQTSPDRGSGD